MSTKLIQQLVVSYSFSHPENETHKVRQPQLACFALYYEIFFISSLQTKVNKNAKHVETGLHKIKTHKASPARKTNLADSRPLFFILTDYTAAKLKKKI